MGSCTTLAAIGLHMATLHVTEEKNYFNNVNPGLYVRTGCGVQAGVFYNSFRKPSAYVAYVHDFKGPFWIGGGAITGYPSSPVLPMAMGGLRLRLNSYNLRIGYTPGIEAISTVNMVHFAIEKRF